MNPEDMHGVWLANGMSEVGRKIVNYFNKRKLKWPTNSEARDWVDTEMGEAAEIMLAKSGGWTRNHPEGKPSWNPHDYAEELGDAIMMIEVMGLVMGVDPIAEMLKKMEHKTSEPTWKTDESKLFGESQD